MIKDKNIYFLIRHSKTSWLKTPSWHKPPSEFNTNTTAIMTTVKSPNQTVGKIQEEANFCGLFVLFFHKCSVGVEQGWPALVLERHSPAEFTSDPNQAHLKQLIKV